MFLQLRISRFNDIYLGLCSVLAIVSLIYLIIMLIFLLKTLYKIDIDILTKEETKQIYGTLYEGIHIRTSDPKGKYLNLLILFRGMWLVTQATFFSRIILLFRSFPLYIRTPTLHISFLWRKPGNLLWI